jgi:hypothetical protein
MGIVSSPTHTTYHPQPSSTKVAPGIWSRYVRWMYSAVQSETGQTMVPAFKGGSSVRRGMTGSGGWESTVCIEEW